MQTIQAAKSVAVVNKIDLVICDMNLPDGNGLDFIKWMKQQNKAYIICLTALDQEINQVMGYEAGADDYITKPFSLSVLLLKIDLADKSFALYWLVSMWLLKADFHWW